MNSETPTHRICAGCGTPIDYKHSVRYTATRGVWHEDCWHKNGGRRK